MPPVSNVYPVIARHVAPQLYRRQRSARSASRPLARRSNESLYTEHTLGALDHACTGLDLACPHFNPEGTNEEGSAMTKRLGLAQPRVPM